MWCGLESGYAGNNNYILPERATGGITAASVTASIIDISFSGMALDIGIAKLHFELGAGGGVWDCGNGAVFHKP